MINRRVLLAPALPMDYVKQEENNVKKSVAPTLEWVGTGRTAKLCFPIPPVATVHATFTAHGDRLPGPLPSFPFRLPTRIPWYTGA